MPMVDAPLVKINHADLEQLQQLKFIGPKRAQRILRFREFSGQIPDAITLATATGMSLKQCHRLSSLIDYKLSSNKPIGFVFALPVFFVVLMLVAGIGLSQLFILEAQRPLEVIYNGSLLFIILACLCTFLAGILQTLSFEHEGHAVDELLIPLIRLVTVTFSLSGAGLMLSVITLTALLETDAAFRSQLQLVWQFGCYLIVIYWALYGPRAHLQFFGSTLTHRGLNFSAIGYDVTQPLLLSGIIAIQWFTNSETLLEELFGIWAIISFGISGIEMMSGSSPYVQGLSETDRRILQHNLATQPFSDHSIKNPPGTLWRRLMGLILLLESLLLVAVIIATNMN